jgi:hypothetical protein
MVLGAIAVAIAVIAFLASKGTMSVLEPAGPIANQQRNLIVFASLL